MPVLKKLYFVLLPTLLFVFTIAGMVTYNFASNHAKHMYLDNVQSEVNTALVAAEYEQLGLSLLVKDIGSSLQFLRYIQNPGNYTTLSLLEKRVLRVINQNHVNQFGQRNIYVIDPKFNLTLSTLRADPFEGLKIPDNIYEKVFDIYTSLVNKKELSQKGFSYISVSGELRYAHIAAIDPYLLPQDKRASGSLNRYILIADGPLKQLSRLLIKYNDDDNMRLLIEPSSDAANIENRQFVIKSIEQTKDSINVQMTSKHLIAQVIIREQKFNHEKAMIAKRTLLGCFATLFTIMLLVHLVVRYQLVRPLKDLLHEISIGGLKLRYFKRSSGQSEIDGLKNAYIDSLTELKFEAEFDQLTKLANRRSFIRHLDVRLKSSMRPSCYLVCWDIIDFRKINDLYGAKVGDNVLVSLAKALRETLQNQQSSLGFSCSDYSLARLGGNQFIAILEMDDHQSINEEIENINNTLTGTTFLDYYGFRLSIATGVLPVDTPKFEEIWHRCIDEMLINAKSHSDGESRIVYGEELLHTLERHDIVEKRLLECCESDNFELRFMPIFNAQTLHIDGAECLIRCPALFDINAGPDEFIPVAEKSNLISKLDMWVISTAIKSYKELSEIHRYTGTLSINISAMELYNRNFADNIRKVLERYKVSPAKIIIEITETSYVKSTKLTVQTIESLRSLGLKVSLDDFGTGYTAFNQLLHYPVDELKVDKSFIDNIANDKASRKMVESMVNLGHSCDTLVVGEGVESMEQYQYLKEANCDLIQGYLFSQPLTYLQFIEFVRDHNPQAIFDTHSAVKSNPNGRIVALTQKK
ncbi:putative bifunctional diguanylate cyclase/phosphodiesterase [Vibrio splendidus]|uniref:putative bifunctional diguanylate cyclase/phosphodiesterase n=1 Tax=Vibrio splendidus TaxID=29497 RepID=UPI000C82BB88|nr:bifunctional diguanylate cyclase/phosphodiesterase [Vibrio splendidus]PMI76774.1 diguanylate phosphodiesterase [Vibrio splendidus]PMK58148.1 diguanylate phosphodiesterase [Vibrio splendidus]